MIKILTIKGEIDATIMKGLLDENGIKASIGPGEGSIATYPPATMGPDVPYDVFVEEKDADKARAVLKEASFIS